MRSMQRIWSLAGKKLTHRPYASTAVSSSTFPDSSKESNVDDNKDDKKKGKKPRGVTTQSAELKKYIATIPSPPIPKRLIRIQSNPPETVYLIDKTVARTMSEKLADEHLDPEATVIEINPGFGVLTSALRGLNFQKINCFEDDNELREKLMSKFRDGINAIPIDFMELPCLHHVDQIDGGVRVETALKSLVAKESSKSNKLYIFGASFSQSPVNFALNSLITQKFVFEENWNWDVTYYLALGSKVNTVLTSSPDSGYMEYRQSSVTFQLFFKHECLATLPRMAYLPWQTQKVLEKNEHSKAQIRHDPEVMYFVKFKPNHELVSRVGKDNLTHLWYFIKHHMYIRKSAIIPELERWIPGCGPRLIRQGYTIYTQFGSLSPEKMLELFLEFSSWPEFASCSFITAVDKFMSKLHASDDDM